MASVSGDVRSALPFGQRVHGVLAAPADLRPVSPHLPCGDTQHPRERVAPRIKLARPAEDAEQGLLGRVLRLSCRQAALREGAQERPETPEERIEGRAVPPRESGQLVLERSAPAGIHGRPLGLTSGRSSERSTPVCRPRSRSADCSCDSPPTLFPMTEPPPSEPPARSTCAFSTLRSTPGVHCQGCTRYRREHGRL